MDTVRSYLLMNPRSTAAEVMRDAFVVGEPGAEQLVRFVLELRVNVRRPNLPINHSKRTKRFLDSHLAGNCT